MNRLLIIDDDLNLLRHLKLVFEQENFIVETAGSGTLGIEMFKKNPCSIVITDLFIPGIDGIQIIKSLKELCPETNIIIISGEFSRDGINYDKIALHSGAEYALTKPINLGKLIGIVEYMLAN